MDARELISKYLPLVRKNWLPLAFGSLGLILFAYGLIGSFFGNQAGPEDVVFEANSSVKQNAIEIKTILVDIEGAVARPGVYKLPEQSRVQDGLVAAGGLSALADRDYVAKSLNLAIKLTDGTKLYIPAVGDMVKNEEVLSAVSESIAVEALININSASESELDSLPGIGPVTAKKVIAGRPYGSVDELLSRKIVGSKVFEQIKEKVAVY